jgi:hypothetical protein
LGGRNLPHFKILFNFLFAALTNFLQKTFPSINTKCCLGWLLMLQHEKRKTDIIIQNPPIRTPYNFAEFDSWSPINCHCQVHGEDWQASMQASQQVSKQASNLLAVLTQKNFGSSKTYLHQNHDMNLAPPQNLCREGYLNMTVFVLRATVGGDREYPSFLLLWLHQSKAIIYVLWTLSLLCFPAWPGMHHAWSTS